MDIDISAIDRNLSDISGKIDFYSFLTPINQEEERKRFFSSLEENKPYNPVFCYKSERDFSAEREWLEDTRKLLDPEDPLHQIFVKNADFISAHLDMLESDDKGFSELAIKSFGSPDKDSVDLAKKILDEGRASGYIFPEEAVTPEEMASILEKKLESAGIEWDVVISGKIIPKITVSGKNRTIYVNSGINYTEAEVERLKIHEIEVHVYRGANGSNQPYNIFAEGLAGYNETEEGLAIYMEEKAGCLELDTRQMKLYAGRALAVDHSLRTSFYETFKVLCGYFSHDLAYRLTERVKRGLKDTSIKGAFTKDFHYISGFRKVREYLDDNGDISILYVGKVGLDDLQIVKKLMREGVLKPPGFIPDFIK